MTSEEFKQARLRLGLRQKALGIIMGMVPQSINKIERGHRGPTVTQSAFLRYIVAHPPTPEDVEREAAIQGITPPPENASE